jgi:glutaminyl-peptide cyclotransferase
MKKSFFTAGLIFFLFVTFLSCSNRPNRSRKPVSSISVIPRAKNYIYGQTVSVKVKTKLKNGEIKNIRLFYKNKLLKESNKLNFTIDGVKLNFIGKNSLRVVATKTDSVSNSRVISINVVSDVKPISYTYQTVNTFPHNKKFFTQGLEFHNGFLYEGTGEKGASGLFKIDLNSGNILKKFLLDEKYFGEGITIFNEKIYQLTYRAQKGFIYNLNDLARIDSFHYKSAEGWGLTNDGKNLIMSNGTHELTWLDPKNFSEVKKIQVANNREIINNLNELEYIEGSIFANVYTTSLIIEIDPETGKVLSQTDLEGLLNLYQKSSDTIDYLNGIAYDAEYERLFVTGKWWPRLFEIELIRSE